MGGTHRGVRAGLDAVESQHITYKNTLAASPHGRCAGGRPEAILGGAQLRGLVRHTDHSFTNQSGMSQHHHGHRR